MKKLRTAVICSTLFVTSVKTTSLIMDIQAGFQIPSLLLVIAFLSNANQDSIKTKEMFLPTGRESPISFNKEDLTGTVAVVSWTRDSNVLLTYYLDVNITYKTQYPDKFRLSSSNTLIFINPRMSDSGVYSAKLIGDHEKVLMEFNVTFQDPVSPVELNVVPKLNASTSVCNLTVTCSTPEANISSTFRCDNLACQKGGARSEVTKSGASLSVYNSNGSIICNHSNQVSSTQNTTEIPPCSRPEEPPSFHYKTVIGVVVGVVGVVGAVVGLAVVFFLKRKSMCRGQRSGSDPSPNEAPQGSIESEQVSQSEEEQLNPDGESDSGISSAWVSRKSSQGEIKESVV